jgi:hypothetical protein
MPYFISRPTSRELSEALRASARGDTRYRGRVRTTEEAHDIERRLARQGESFERPFLVSNDSPEAHQARIELAQRAGFGADPEKAIREGLV